MREPSHPAKTEHDLQLVLKALHEKSEALEAAEPELSDAVTEFELAKAKAMVAADGKSEEVRKAQALLASEYEYRTFMSADGKARGLRARVTALRYEVTGATSLNASARELSKP